MKPLYTLLIVLMPFIGLSKSESNTISEPISASVVVDEINSLDCIDPSLINPDAICFFIYDPVCGCNNVTYSNSCFAENSGVLSWVNGECSSATVFGCTDETATNFNASATTDDGSCTYLEPEGFNVTFSINTANIIVGPNGMYIGGGMFGDAMALPLSDDDGDGIWTGVTFISNGASGNYTLLNSPNNGGDWGAKENIAGLPCADAANWNDRILPAISSDTTLLHCFETCGTDGTCPLISGCTDESAMNYNPAASEDDGSCEFLVDGESPYCDTQIYHFAIEAEVVSSVFLSIGNNGPNSIIIQVESADADPVDDLIIYSSTAGNTLGELSSNNGIYSNTMTWNSDVNTVDINVLWSKQSFGGNWQLSQNNLTINVNDTCDISITPSISGCTDATAVNYNPDANLDDGSCEFCIDSDLIDSNAFCIEIYEPVCGCNNVTFNNSCYAEISGVVNWIAGECSSSNVFGCTDETASNYNPDAIMDDGSCVACQELTTINFSVDASYLISAEYDNVLVNGSWDAFGDSNQYWGAWGVTLTDDNMDGIYTGSLSLEPGFYEYVHALSGPADGNSGWGIIGYAPDDCALGTNPISGDDAPNYYFDAQCGQVIDLPIICFGECNDCSVIITTGCMDPSADNYNPGATEDDGSCTYCEEFQVSILSTQDVYFEGSSDGYVIATGVNGTNDYNIIVFDLNGTQQNPFALSAGVYIVSVTDMISGCTSEAQFSINELFSNIPGCTDSLANNFNPEANIDNGDCDYCLNFLNSLNDIVDYSCDDSQEFDTINTIIENNPNTGSPHINLPNEICYTISPPSSGPHRSSWAKWGEYEYLPPQRWLHNLEHGGIAFLYHPCAEQSVIDSLRNIACSMPDDETGAFRWVLTPYPNLPSKISIVAWEWSYSKNSVDSDEIFTFILEHYRQAPEDFPHDGSYNDLYIGKCSELIGCTDQDAENDNPIAVVDDGSCIEEHYHVCENEIEGLFVNNIIHNRVVFNWDSPEENPSHYMIRYRPVGTSSWTVMSAGPVNSNEFNGTSRTRYFMQPGTTYEWNIRA
ncbi:MAG: DUF3105 domain-containing protein, partial [Bacteroidota bacterium]|nr:DUF3105 domain-containing protein [Bacteroidota bacterium]